METTASTNVTPLPSENPVLSQDKLSLKDRIREAPINWYAVLMGLMGAIAIAVFGIFFYLPLKSEKDQCLNDKSDLQAEVDGLTEDCGGDSEDGDDGGGTEGGGETCDCGEPEDDGDPGPETCSVELTADEQAIVADWNTFRFGLSGMSFKYPNDFNIEYISTKVIQLETSGYGFIAGRFDGGIVIEPPDRETTTDVTLWCTDARRIVKEWDADAPGDFSNMRKVETLITFDGSTYYYVTVAYHYEGASVSADIVELYDILLKTVRFD